MRILIEITHPAHVHFFRNAAAQLQHKGHIVAVTARDKDVTLELLENYNLSYTVLSKIGKGKLSLISELISRDFRLYRFCRKFKPDVLTGISGVFAAHVGRLIGKPVVVWDDTEIATLAHKIAYPFVSAIYTPDCYMKDLGPKQRRYAGCHELAYLRPNYFTPDKQLVRSLGVDPDQKYCIVRFVSWQAHHDVGQHGVAEKQRINFVEQLAKHARILITSESPLPPELEKYRLNIPVHQIHHLLAFADLYIGEGATMASEAAVLGVPSVYINTLRAGTINKFSDYGLITQTSDTDVALKMSVELLTEQDKKDKYFDARDKYLSDSIDVTAFIVETIQNAERP